jgi:hypothetical protein
VRLVAAARRPAGGPELRREGGVSMRLEPRAVAALLSVLLHLAALFALLRVTASVAEPPWLPVARLVHADTLRDAGERIVSVDIRPGLWTTPAPVCAGSTYIGVGVTADPRTERILMVGDDTPASRAGLQRDDIVLNPEVWRDAHREGALLRLLVLREGGIKTVVAVRVGWICIG